MHAKLRTIEKNFDMVCIFHRRCEKIKPEFSGIKEPEFGVNTRAVNNFYAQTNEESLRELHIRLMVAITQNLV